MRKRIILIGTFCTLAVTLMACSTDNVRSTVVTENSNTETETENVKNSEINWSYEELEDGTLSIYAYDAENVPETIEIPSEINGKMVTKLEGVFSQEDRVKRVVIPESVTIIGSDTFLLSSSIEEVDIEGNIESVGENAFFCCEKLNKLYFNEGLKKIYTCGIEGCPSLKEVHLPNTLEEIERWSFRKCSPDLVIYAPAGSYVEEYAKEVEVSFQAE